MSKLLNPWEEISLSDYENHMSLESVKQLQAMNEMMNGQLERYPVASAMVLGIAGGNGLEYVSTDKYQRVYGIDINAEYLKAVQLRYLNLEGVLQCLHINLIEDAEKLPTAELIIANLLVEYIGYEVFKKTVLYVNPRYVSCIIQINTDKDTWVSDSPYLHVFDGLDAVRHQVEENSLASVMSEIGYKKNRIFEYPLPNGKKLVQMDFER